jgi:hypothetical protein
MKKRPKNRMLRMIKTVMTMILTRLKAVLGELNLEEGLREFVFYVRN